MRARSVIQWLSRKYNHLETFAALLGAGLIVFMMGLTVVDVTTRATTQTAIHGTYDLAQFMMVGIIFLGASYVQSIKGHVEVSFLTSRLGDRTRLGLQCISWLVGAVMFGIMTWRTGVYAWESWVSKDYIMGLARYPLWPAQSLVPLGVGMMTIRLLIDFVETAIEFIESSRGGATEGSRST